MSPTLDAFLRLLASHSAAAAVLVVLVAIAQRVFRRHLSPRWRAALWLLVALRLLPVSIPSDVSVFNLLPPWSAAPRIEAAAAEVAPGAIPSFAIAPKSDVAPASDSAPSSPSLAADAARPKDTAGLPPWTSWTFLLFAGWSVGATALAAFVFFSAWKLARSIGTAPRLRDPELLELLAACGRAMGVRRVPELRESHHVRSPALYGGWRPRLLLPVGFARAYSRDELRFVFLHELAHLRRYDLPLNWILTALQVVHWFNPFVWFAFARWRAEREMACDAAALEAAGPEQRRAYGRTMLRLLQTVSASMPQPGLVGILEQRRGLEQRIRMIARFTPGTRPFAAVGLGLILGLVGLTNAQVPAPAEPRPAPSPAPAAVTRTDVIPQPATPYTLFLVNGSETMRQETPAGQLVAETSGPARESGGPAPAASPDPTFAQKSHAPKWLRTVRTLEQLLAALPSDTRFHVRLFSGDTVVSLGSRTTADDRQAIPTVIARLRQTAPDRAHNLETAFAAVADLPDAARPERIVLLTDGLPTTSTSSPSAGEVPPAARVQAFQLATRRLPPRIPVHTILLPAPFNDPAAAGLFWELANATRGGLTVPAKTGGAAPTHLAFVVDTSGSMRDPNTGGLWPAVLNAIEATLASQPQLAGVQLLDGDGRFILGRRGTGLAGWQPNTPETIENIRRVLRQSNQDTVSNPIPGIANALRFLRDQDVPNFHMGVYVLGDEFNSRDPGSAVLDRLATLNPADAEGRRPITISAIGFPTTIRTQFSMGNTGLRFANLMRAVTSEHGGAFIALPDL